MSQLGFNSTSVVQAGTQILTDRSGDLVRVLFTGTYVGTVVLNDASTTGGTTAIVTIPIPATAIPSSMEIGRAFQYGLTAVATGTPTLTVIWN